MALKKLLAQSSVNYQLDGPNFPTSNLDATTRFEKLASNAIGILTIVAVLFFAIQIILAGFGFISSGHNEKEVEANSKKLTNSVLGLLIVVVAVGIGSLIARLLGLNNIFDINQMFINMGL